jgi:hypothetical protein
MIYQKVILNISPDELNWKVCLIITNNFEKSVDEFPLLRTFIYSNPKERIEDIMDSMAYTCKIEMRIGIRDKYYIMVRPEISNSEIAHESFHLALRVLGISDILNGEEIYAYLIQESYEKIEEQIIKYRHKES